MFYYSFGLEGRKSPQKTWLVLSPTAATPGSSCRLQNRRCGTPLLCTRVLQSLMLKGDLLNRRWLKSGSGEIPLNEGHLAVPDRASSNTSSPYVSQVIPNIRKYIEHTAQTTHACAANAFFSIRQLQLCNTHAPTISISIYIYIYLNHTIIFVSSSYTAFLNQKQINILCA